jgi:hypothetical protein
LIGGWFLIRLQTAAGICEERILTAVLYIDECFVGV